MTAIERKFSEKSAEKDLQDLKKTVRLKEQISVTLMHFLTKLIQTGIQIYKYINHKITESQNDLCWKEP